MPLGMSPPPSTRFSEPEKHRRVLFDGLLLGDLAIIRLEKNSIHDDISKTTPLRPLPVKRALGFLLLDSPTFTSENDLLNFLDASVLQY
jgi:hypothetical protein